VEGSSPTAAMPRPSGRPAERWDPATAWTTGACLCPTPADTVLHGVARCSRGLHTYSYATLAL